MKNIRIGKDIALQWTVTVDGVSRDLSELDLRLFLHNETTGSSVELAFTTNVDVLRAEVLGRDQRNTGVYRLTLWLNKDKIGQSVLDESTAFRLVARTEMEGGEDDNNLTTETVELSGNLEVNPSGDISDLERRVEALEGLTLTSATANASDVDLVHGEDGEADVVLSTIPAATSETAGVMSALQVQELAGKAEATSVPVRVVGESDRVAVYNSANEILFYIPAAKLPNSGVMSVQQAFDLINLKSSVPTKQDKVALVEEDSASLFGTLTPAIDTYTRIGVLVGAMAIQLPAIPVDTTTALALSIYLETGSSPQVTFTSADNTPIAYYDGFALDANGKYEISAMYNGSKWIMAHGTIA